MTNHIAADQGDIDKQVETACNVFKSIFFNAGMDNESNDDQMRRAMYAALSSIKPLPDVQREQVAWLKDHEIASIVNQLRDISVQFHGAQQLRDRIAHCIVDVLKGIKPAAISAQVAQASEEEIDRLIRKVADTAFTCGDHHVSAAEWSDQYPQLVEEARNARKELRKFMIFAQPSAAIHIDIESLAQEIRRVDGNHLLGAGALAEALMPFLQRGNSAPLNNPDQSSLRTAVHDAIAASLGDAYDCLRVWEAWNIGTMSQDDFSLVAEDSDRMEEITDAVMNVIKSNMTEGVVLENDEKSYARLPRNNAEARDMLKFATAWLNLRDTEFKENAVLFSDDRPAREWLNTWMRKNFRDRSFGRHIREEIACDFACELASALVRLTASAPDQSNAGEVLGKSKATAAMPQRWITDQCGGEFVDMTAGQGYRKGWNDCRDAFLAATTSDGQVKSPEIVGYGLRSLTSGMFKDRIYFYEDEASREKEDIHRNTKARYSGPYPLIVASQELRK